MGATVAALYVASGGPYFGLDGVDPWDEARDARRYRGPHPVVAHSPCQRWGKMWRGQPGNIKRGKVEKLGDDGGCFQAAIDAVRKWGGVLEHPEHSRAWPAFGIARPPRAGGWVSAGDGIGYTCRVEQGQYGHYAPKPTWLYAAGIDNLPALRWGVNPVMDDMFPAKAVEKHGIAYCRRAGLMSFRGGGRDSAPRIHTPAPFRDLLLSMAKRARPTWGSQS